MHAAIDTSVWIGAFRKKDQWHDQAKPIIEAFAKGEISRVYITDYIVLETVNFLLRKTDIQTTVNVLKMFRHHNRIEIISVDADLFEKSCDLVEKYEISLGDASMIAMMKNLDLNVIYSFDSGIDRLPGVIRKIQV